ncbi:MAG: hypothetical protein ACD_2C00172G0007 [uncultured bacterium (gcode 4)]|uniref:LemA family protein n=1 Tax=uncultured bacterium (gcode 4) TaxID=1234023 RepID=K2GGC1_9BACT|nr:MAG: hypothetical protein ACD_2C00172G0007 [uncultured bacterium (gcode 4)]
MWTSVFIIIAVIIVVIFTVVWIYNSIISAKNTVEESFSAIDAMLQQRYDLIPNLVEVVKQYATHERETLSKVTEMRANLLNSQGATSEQRFQNENMLTAWLKSVFAVAENYPDLKASQNFINLQNQWGEMENNIQASRRAYNAAVKELNNKKEMFPLNMIAGMMNIQGYAMFLAQEEAKAAPSAKALFN